MRESLERIESEQEDEAIAEEQLEAEPERDAVDSPSTNNEKTLEDEIELMSPEEVRAFAKRTLRDRREANSEAARRRREADELKAKIAADEAAKKKAKREAEIAAMTEQDKARAMLADAQERERIALEKARKLEAENAIIGIATRLKFNDPSDAAKLIAIDTVMTDGAISTASIEEQVKELAQNRPYLVEQPKKRVYEQPPSLRTDNPVQPPTGLEHLTSKNAVALQEAHQEFQKVQQGFGPQAALNTARAFRRLADLDPDIRSGKAMEDALKAQGRKDRMEDG